MFLLDLKFLWRMPAGIEITAEPVEDRYAVLNQHGGDIQNFFFHCSFIYFHKTSSTISYNIIME